MHRIGGGMERGMLRALRSLKRLLRCRLLGVEGGVGSVLSGVEGGMLSGLLIGERTEDGIQRCVERIMDRIDERVELEVSGGLQRAQASQRGILRCVERSVRRIRDGMERGMVSLLTRVKLIMGRGCRRMERGVIGVLAGVESIVRGISRGVEGGMLRRVILMQRVMGNVEGGMSDVLSGVEYRVVVGLFAMETGVIPVRGCQERGPVGILCSVQQVVQRVMGRMEVGVCKCLIEMEGIVGSAQSGQHEILTGLERVITRRLIGVKARMGSGERGIPRGMQRILSGMEGIMQTGQVDPGAAASGIQQRIERCDG